MGHLKLYCSTEYLCIAFDFAMSQRISVWNLTTCMLKWYQAQVNEETKMILFINQYWYEGLSVNYIIQFMQLILILWNEARTGI